MNDYQIRNVIKEQEFRNHYKDPNTKIIEELGVSLGNSKIDIAVLNGSMQGYEIKSDKDTLVRLQGQISEYNKVFDYLTIVTSIKYAPIISDFIPNWWGILTVENTEKNIFLREVREAKQNEEINAISLLQLLWKQELIQMIDEYFLPNTLKNKPKKIMWEALSQNIELGELKDKVRNYLKNRTNWREN